jgi:carbon-monoxide dehydrogenase small subunit
MKKLVSLTVNGIVREAAVEPRRTLLEFLREDLGLTGTKKGCGIGDCGACTVLVDGVATFSCLTLVMQVEGCSVETVESLAKAGKPNALQKAFIEKGAVQCGYCTPGMLMTATELLRRNPRPDEHEIRRAISGNLCRCTGYQKIVEAIQSAGSEDEPVSGT